MPKFSWEIVKKFFSNITLEPTFFFFALANGFYIIVSSSLYISKVCNVNLNYTREICDDIQNHPEEQIEVQRYVSSLQAYNSIIQAIPACIYSLFAGPWSDRHGRKILIVASTFGYVFNNAVFMLNLYFFYELKAEWLLFECLQDMTGGTVCFYIGCYSYIADITDSKSRTTRLALMDGLFPLGFYIGNALSGYIKNNLGFMYNFSLGMLFSMLAMAYTLIFVKDSKELRDKKVEDDRKYELENTPDEKERKEKIKAWKDDADADEVLKNQNIFAQLFNWNNLKASWIAILRKRDGHKRAFIILIILAYELEFFLTVGRWSSTFLFFRKQLKWTEIDFSRYTTIRGVISLLSQYIAVPFLCEKLKLHDSTISLIDAVTSFFNQFVIAFCVNEWMLYLGQSFSFLDYASNTLFRSMITKSVNTDEVGKIFAVVGTFQALIPFASSPTFGFLYRSTVAYFPAAFLLLIAAVKFLEVVIISIVNYGMRKEEKEFEMIQKEKKKEEEEGIPLKELELKTQ